MPRAKSTGRTESRRTDHKFWSRLKEIAVPGDLSWDSGDYIDPCIRDTYEKLFNAAERKLLHLMNYAVLDDDDKPGRPQVLHLLLASEVGNLQQLDGILYKGKKYYTKFMKASDLEAAVMWNYDDIPQVCFVNPSD